MYKWIKNVFGKKQKSWYKRNYPKTVEEVLDDTIKYRQGTHDAIRKFKKSKPWHGEDAERKVKFLQLNADLAAVYEIEAPQLIFVKRFEYGSCYWPKGNLIILESETDGRYSVVTFLHEFGHALHKDEKDTCRWSINLFRLHFPKSYGKLVPKGHLLYRKGSVDVQEG